MAAHTQHGPSFLRGIGFNARRLRPFAWVIVPNKWCVLGQRESTIVAEVTGPIEHVRQVLAEYSAIFAEMRQEQRKGRSRLCAS
jgi:hypothetical protein